MRRVSRWPLPLPAFSQAKAKVRLAKDGEGFKIDRIALTLQAKVPGIDDAQFQKIAQEAKSQCPLSKALAGVPEVTLVATLLH